MKNLAMAFLGVNLISWTIYAEQLGVKFLEHEINLDIVVDGKAPSKFTPFTLDDICKIVNENECAKVNSPDEVIRYVTSEVVGNIEKEVVVFEGKAQEYLDYLNSIEKKLAENGYSLRDATQDFWFREIPTDINSLRQKLLQTLGIYSPKVLDLIKPPLLGEDCLQIPVAYLDKIPEKMPKPSSAEITRTRNVLNKLNESQRILCSVGYSFMDIGDLLGLESNTNEEGFIDRFIAQAIEKRDQIIHDLGLSEYLAAFNLVSFDEIKDYYEIYKDIEEILTAKQFPGPEKLEEVRKQLNTKLPDHMQIPPVPSIPAAEPPQRMELTVKKKKSWEGFQVGDKNLVATGASAYTLIAGSEYAHAYTAFAEASMYLLSSQINMLSGYGYAEAGPERVALEMKMTALGQDLFEPIKKEHETRITVGEPHAFGYNFDESKPFNFAIGPVPVSVTIGARAYVGLGYEVGLLATRIYGKVLPKAEAAGYANAGVGVGGWYSAGAGAELVLLDLQAPLTAEAGIKFDDADYPYLSVHMRSDARYEYLNGRMYAYAEYTVPKLSYPPYQKKKDYIDIFKFDGQRLNHSIINWGIEVGRMGTKLSGDLIDQIDRREAEKLNEAISLENKKAELANYEQQVYERANRIFTTIHNDLNSNTNLESLNRAEEVKYLSDQFYSNLEQFGQLVYDLNSGS